MRFWKRENLNLTVNVSLKENTISPGATSLINSYLGVKVDASNQFTGDAAREFFEDAGFEPHAARALAERSDDVEYFSVGGQV